ncbi:MAG: hypothetical protein V1821_03470 [bacterium]
MKRFAIVATTLTSVLLLSESACTKTPEPKAQTTIDPKPDPWQRFRNRNLSFVGGHNDDVWLLQESQIQAQEFAIVREVAGAIAKKVNRALKNHRTLPEVAALETMFQNKFYISFFLQSTGTSVIFTNQEEAPPSESQIEVVLVVKGAENHPRINNQLQKYDPEWRSLFLACYEFSPEWFEALAIHELEHARADRLNLPGAHADKNSAAWVAEEIGAHDLERRVLDNATAGGYAEKLTEISRKHINAPNLEALWQNITLDDLQNLDSVFGAAGEREASLRSAQYLIDLTYLYLAGRQQGAELKDRRIAAYKQLQSLF